MDMTDLMTRAPVTVAPATEEEAPVEQDHWRDVVSEMSAEIAGPLTAALDRVQTLATTGRIDRGSLRALGEEIERARQISMSGQQIARLASGRLWRRPRWPRASPARDVRFCKDHVRPAPEPHTARSAPPQRRRVARKAARPAPAQCPAGVDDSGGRRAIRRYALRRAPTGLCLRRCGPPHWRAPCPTSLRPEPPRCVEKSCAAHLVRGAGATENISLSRRAQSFSNSATKPAAACRLSITMASLSCCFAPANEKFAEPERSTRPST